MWCIPTNCIKFCVYPWTASNKQLLCTMENIHTFLTSISTSITKKPLAKCGGYKEEKQPSDLRYLFGLCQI